ncbi:MAG: Crp/Fnr family transcriptional regulator, partial [Candidatus Acidiferrales bacterium]
MNPDLAVHSGERTNAGGKPISNRILLSIPPREFRAIRRYLELVPLRHHSILHEPTRRLLHAYFPNSGLISMVVATEDGRMVEAGVVGHEGVAGVPVAFDLPRCPLRQVVQISGDALRITAGALLSVLKSTPQFQLTLARYGILQGMQVAQTAACNRLHDVSQRLARWLLMAQDRVDSGSLPITHDFLATMLGTDRPSVTLAAGALQKK